jgi:hypothetical protein
MKDDGKRENKRKDKVAVWFEVLSAHLPGEKKTMNSGWTVSEPKLEASTSQIRSTNPDYSNTAFCDETKRKQIFAPTVGQITTLEVRSNI